MKKIRNILITTLGYTKDHLNIEYYSSTDKANEVKFCTGISSAEAGTKYILAKQKIDEIFVLGPPNVANKKDEQTYLLSYYQLTAKTEPSEISEFSFFCYRMAQYLNGIDIEANDILYYAPKEKREQLQAFIKERLPRGREGQFYQIAMENNAYNSWRKMTKDISDIKELRWLKHMMYQEMDSYHKLRARRDNDDVKVRFIPIEKNEKGSFSINDLVALVGRLVDEAQYGLTIHVDLQGMDRADSYTMWSMLSMVYCSEAQFLIETMIQTKQLANSFIHCIDDEIRRYDVDLLLSGVRSFLKYGKADMLEEYCQRHNVTEPVVLNLLKAMRYVDTGVTLCNMADLKYGIEALKMIFHHSSSERMDEQNSMIFSIIRRTIQEDYGPLLEGDEINVLDLINWALQKQFYQQALTMIESLVPADMVKRGICYYAKDDADIEKALAAWNVLYWNEIPKCRYTFNDLDHYFIKNYGRTVINNRQAKDRVVCDIAQAIVNQLDGKNPELCNVYSELDDKAMLYELLVSYYTVGNVRNQVCHATIMENALQNQEEMQENKSMEMLQNAIRRFLNIYKSACACVADSAFVPKQITAMDFRAYTSQHRLQILSATDNGFLAENTYQCQYDGKNLHITVHMLYDQKM